MTSLLGAMKRCLEFLLAWLPTGWQWMQLSNQLSRKKDTKTAKRNAAVQEEVDKLLKAGFIRESRYPEWITNVVIVTKSNGKWRMCVDYIDLNWACPKDSFPLPKIDQLIDSTVGNKLISFMDAFSGYNQIMMHPSDQDKTSFITG